MSKIHIIEDEGDLREIIEVLLIDNGLANVACHENWESCNASDGDIIIHDVYGVGKIKSIDNVKYISLSGDVTVNPDIIKPFDISNLVKKIKEAKVLKLDADKVL